MQISIPPQTSSNLLFLIKSFSALHPPQHVLLMYHSSFDTFIYLQNIDTYLHHVLSHLYGGFSPQGNILWQDGNMKWWSTYQFSYHVYKSKHIWNIYIFTSCLMNFFFLFWLRTKWIFLLVVAKIFILAKILKTSRTSFLPLFFWKKIDSLLFLMSSLEDKRRRKRKP